MSRRILLVDADVDALGALASALRARGLTVSNADEGFDALEQAFRLRPDVVLLAKDLDLEGDVTAGFRAVPELIETPILLLVNGKQPDSLEANEVLRGDVDHVITRITLASPPSRPLPAQDVRGHVEQVPLVDILQLLAMNRRSGVLTLTTESGAGELQLADGEVIDAVFRKLAGEKALYRMLGERAGHFAFTQGEPVSTRRIKSTTSMLLMEAMRQVDELARRRASIAPGNDALLMEDASPPVSVRGSLARPGSMRPPGTLRPPPARQPGSGRPPGSTTRPPGSTTRPPPASMRSSKPPPLPPSPEGALARDVEVLLQIPRSIDELLDELGAPDPAILDVIAALTSAGRIRRVPLATLTTPFASPEQMPVFRSLVTRLTRAGFAPPPRLVIAGNVKRMPALAQAVRRITDAVVPSEGPPRAALPRMLGTLRLGDGVELGLTGLPVEDSLSPTWALAVAGAAAVVRLGDAGGEELDACCAAMEVMLIDADSLMTPLDAAVPAQVAALVRAALEMAAGV
jgi:CheY-like chemotaxis protein